MTRSLSDARLAPARTSIGCALLVVAAHLLATPTARADAPTEVDADVDVAEEVSERTPFRERAAFDRDFALAIYGTGWVGRYAAGGGGARARWEPFDRLGVEVYTEHLKVIEDEGLRHDHPIGFNLYVPFQFGERFRLRPLFGFCTVFSFFHPDQEGVERIDDVHFGVHAGLGAEVSFGRFVSLFVDVQGVAYFGHDRYAGGWATHVGDNLSVWGLVQGAAGIQVHL